MNNYLGIHALVWAGSWHQEDRKNAIANTASCGYDLIEIPLLEPTTVDVPATVKLLEQYKLKAATSLALSIQTDISSTEPEVVARGEALLNEALSVTRDLGAKYMGGVIYGALHKYDYPPTEAGRQNCAEILARLASKAKEMGITLGLEPVNRYESNLINTAAQALEMIERTGSDNIVVHLDSFHMNIEESSLSGAIEHCGSKLGYFHIGESHRGYLGSGNIDFQCIFSSLRENNYTGTITFESFSSAVVSPNLSNTLAIWRNLWEDSYDLARQAKAFMEQHLQSA
ncbi:MAG: sugar phosphate isomerase/epimerase family protein [Xenococcaceae cyanobacterium]